MDYDVKYTLQCIQNGEMGYICIRRISLETFN